MNTAALYTEPAGAYFGIPGVDPWDEARDARKYSGPWPVVAHPPCQRWGRFWHGSTRKPHQYALGADKGCFAAALGAVRRWGGVLEHPADSKAWDVFGLAKPPKAGGWVRADKHGGWTCYVEQGHYGHMARKGTWLYAKGVDLPELRWGVGEQRLHPVALARYGYEKARRIGVLAMVGGKDKTRIRNATPDEFRDVLIAMARTAKPEAPEKVAQAREKFEKRFPLFAPLFDTAPAPRKRGARPAQEAANDNNKQAEQLSLIPALDATLEDVGPAKRAPLHGMTVAAACRHLSAVTGRQVMPEDVGQAPFDVIDHKAIPAFLKLTAATTREKGSAPVKHIVPVSGGKDSEAVADIVISEYGPENVLLVHQKTGWDSPLTYQHMDYLSRRFNLPIIHVQSSVYADVPDFIRKAGYFPNSAARGCTSRLKQRAFGDWLEREGYCEPGAAIVHLGMRAAEGAFRASKYGGMEPEDELWLPDISGEYPFSRFRHVRARLDIVDWTTEQVFAYLRERGLEVNPLYERGHKRVGCYPCILAGKDEWELCAADPVGADHIRTLGQIQAEFEAAKNPRKYVKVHRTKAVMGIVERLCPTSGTECAWCAA